MAVPVLEPEKRLQELVQSSVEKIPFENGIPVMRYFRSGKELLRMANVYREEGDDERAFLLYMRYMTLFLEKILNHPSYKDADPQEKAFAKKKCKEIFPITEALKSNLKKRYAAQYRIYLEELTAKQKEEERLKAQEDLIRQKQTELERNSGEEQLLNKFREAQERFAASSGQADSYYHEGPTAAVWQSDQLPTEFEDFVDDSSTISPQPPSAPPAIIPRVDRTTKPATRFEESTYSDGQLRRVVVPSDLTTKFLRAVESNTLCNVETCGILVGKLRQNIFTISHVLIPKQKGTSDSCQMFNEEDICIFQDERDLMTLGWIHTHPSQSAFMSSIDLHTHFGYQIMLSEAIAIVCAPKFDQVGLFSLTQDHGIKFIGSCKQSGFHLHPKEPPLYQDCAHVVFDHTVFVQMVDLR